jgi:hypothetical protein
MSLGPKKIRKREREKKKKTKAGQISPHSDEISPKSQFMVAEITVEGILGKKKLKVPTLREIETSGGYIVNF